MCAGVEVVWVWVTADNALACMHGAEKDRRVLSKISGASLIPIRGQAATVTLGKMVFAELLWRCRLQQ
jgi:hypothetical protein